MKSLVLFGDSLLARCRKGEERFLSEKLNEEYQIYNCATGGWDSVDLLKKAPLVGKMAADVVLISVGTNDASPWKQIPLEEFKANIATVYDTFVGSRVIFFPPPPVVENRRVAGKEISNETMHSYNQAVIDFCNEKGIEYWDSWADLEPILDTESDPHNEDGVHFSDTGYEYILGKLAQVVKR